MPNPNGQPNNEAEDLLNVDFGSLLDAHLQAKQKAEGEEAPGSEEQDKSSDGAGSDQSAQAEQQQAEDPKPKKKTWQEIQDEELPEDLPHGFYKGKKLADLIQGVSNAEGQMHKANERANRAETIAAANEVLVQTLQSQLAKLNEGRQTAPQSAPNPYEKLDLENDIVLAPDKVLSAIDEKQRLTLEKERERILADVDKRLKEKDDHDARVKAAEAMAVQAEKAAAEALAELKVPRKYWKDTLDQIVPILQDPNYEYFTKGGILEKDHYKQVVEKSPLLKRAIVALSAEDTGAAPAAPAAAIQNPPGAKAPAVTPKPERPSYRISDDTRRLGEQAAKLAGVTDPAEVEEFIRDVAAKKASYKNSKRRA